VGGSVIHAFDSGNGGRRCAFGGGGEVFFAVGGELMDAGIGDVDPERREGGHCGGGGVERDNDRDVRCSETR